MFTIAVIAFRFSVTAVQFAHESATPAAFVNLVLIGLISAGIPVIAILSVQNGWTVTRLLITLIAIWGASELVSWADGFAIVVAVVSAAMLIAVWMPSSRDYLRERARLALPGGNQ